MGDGSTSQPSQSFCFPDWTRKLQADLSLTPGLRTSYLNITGLEVGLLLNFREAKLTRKRVVRGVTDATDGG